MNTSDKSNSAFVWVTLALIASSIEPLVVKLGYQSSSSALQLLVLKLLFGGLFIAPIYKKLYWIGIDGLKKLSGAVLAFIATYIFIFYSLTTISAIVLVTIITTTPALVALLNQIRGKEDSNRKFWIGFGFCFVGALLSVNILGTSATKVDTIGVLLAFGSVLTSALYRTQMDGLTKEFKPITVSGYLFLINSILALIALPFIGEISSFTWKISAWIGFAGAIANVAFLSALHLIGSTRISIITVLQRPLVIIAAAFFLKEPITFAQGIGIFMVLIGVQLAKVKKVKEDKDTSIEVKLSEKIVIGLGKV